MFKTGFNKTWLVAAMLLASLGLTTGCSDDSDSLGAADNLGGASNNDSNNDVNNDGNNDVNNDFNNDVNNGFDDSDFNNDGPDQDDEEPGGNTNVNLGGAQDFGFFRRQLDDNRVPQVGEFDAAGFFAEHFTPLPEPDCGERICVQAMMGVMGNLVNRNNCTMLQIGLNSPLEADEANRPPLSLAVVVDVSGSMAANGKMEFVRQGLTQLVNELYDDDQIAIITYETRVDVPFEMAPVRGNRNDLLEIVQALRPQGSTNLYDGLERGYRQVFENYDSGRQNRVILLSDGEPTAGITDADEIVDMSRAFNSDGVGLTTVGLGTDFNYTMMRDLAEQADGNFYFLENSAAVDEVFTQELAYFTVPVAFDLVMDVRTGENYTLGAARGSRLWEDTEYGGHIEIPSVFLAHRTSPDDIEPGGGRRGGGSALLVELMPADDNGQELTAGQVATVDLEFREPGTNEIITDSVEVTVPFAPWDTPLRGFFENEIVEKSFVMLNIYVGLEMACGLFHEGDPIEGIVVLDRLIAAAEDYNDSVNNGMGDTDIEFDIDLMEQLIEVILANGGSEPEDSGIDEDPWPAD